MKDIYLTFKTDKFTSDFLKMIATNMGKTQPELINEICKNFISHVADTMNEFKESEEYKQFVANQK